MASNSNPNVPLVDYSDTESSSDDSVKITRVDQAVHDQRISISSSSSDTLDGGHVVLDLESSDIEDEFVKVTDTTSKEELDTDSDDPYVFDHKL